MKMIGPSADALLKMCVIAKSDEEKKELETKGQVDPKVLEASPLNEHDSSMNQNRYTLEVGVNPNLEYDITGVMQTLENLGDAPDYHVVDWNSAQVFMATVMRIATQNVLADFAQGDSSKLMLTEKEDLSDVVQKVPEIWVMKQFYDACFDDLDRDFTDNTFAVSLKTIEEA